MWRRIRAWSRAGSIALGAVVWWGRAAAAAAACGDGVIDGGESCDLGIGNDVGVVCTTRCEPPRCGDGYLDVGEPCDDGNTADGDGCSRECADERAPIWSASLDLGGTGGESFSAIARTATGYLAAGVVAQATGQTAPLVAWFDLDGALMWHDAPPTPHGLGSAAAVLAVDDDRIWIAGTAIDPEAGRRPVLWHLDDRGTQSSAIDLLAIDGDATINTMVADGRGRVFVGGAHATPLLPETGWIGEVDLAAGILLWWIDTPERRRVADLAPMHDGRIAAAGWRSNVLWAGVVDDTGAQVWTQELPNEWEIQERTATAIAVASDDTLYVAGRVSNYVTNLLEDDDGWLGAFAPDGTILWAQGVAGAGLSEGFRDVLVIDGQPVAIGALGTRPLVGSASSDVDVWMQQFDAGGAAQWRWQFDGAMHHVDMATAAIVEDDGTIVVVGSSVEPFALANAWIARARPGQGPQPRRGELPTPAPLGVHTPPVHADGTPSATTLFLDFDGGTLREGTRGDLGELPCLGGVAPYPGLAVDTAEAQAIADRVAVIMDAYAVEVRWGEALPTHLPRTSVMLGGESVQFGLDPSTRGYACVVDCADAWAWDLAFAFAAPAASIANTVAHEAGHTWGLDHVVEAAQIMYPLGAIPTADWGDDACTPVSDQTSPVVCGPSHTRWCDAGAQNSHAELLAAFGPAQPDVAAPELDLVLDATALAQGEPAVAHVTYADDAGVPGVRLRVPELDWEFVVTAAEADFTLPLPVGRYTIVAEAIDHGMNVASATVEVEVGVDDPADETGEAEGSSGGGDDDGDPSSSGDAAVAGSSTGCGCAGGRPDAYGCLALFVTVLRRRRGRLG